MATWPHGNGRTVQGLIRWEDDPFIRVVEGSLTNVIGLPLELEFALQLMAKQAILAPQR